MAETLQTELEVNSPTMRIIHNSGNNERYTPDGINRGNFGRPIVYIFILDDSILPSIETFVNQDMIVNGNAIRSEYNVDFPVLFTENFDLSSIRVSAWVNASHGKANVNTTGRATTTWAELKR